MRVLNIVHPTQYGQLVMTGMTTYTVLRQEMNQDTGNCMYGMGVAMTSVMCYYEMDNGSETSQRVPLQMIRKIEE